MKIRNSSNETAVGIDVDLAKPPTVVRRPDANNAAMSLDWDRALDDNRRLRRCPVCGCPDLFLRKQLPQITSFIAIIAAAIVAMLLYGIGMLWLAVAVLVVVVAADVAIFLYTPRVLECYRCRTQFRGMPINRRHPRWESGTADRYERESQRWQDEWRVRSEEASRDPA